MLVFSEYYFECVNFFPKLQFANNRILSFFYSVFQVSQVP